MVTTMVTSAVVARLCFDPYSLITPYFDVCTGLNFHKIPSFMCNPYHGNETLTSKCRAFSAFLL